MSVNTRQSCPSASSITPLPCRDRSGLQRLLVIVLVLLGHAAAASELVLVADRVILDAPGPGSAALTRVNFRQAYPGPPLVFVLPDDANPDPSTVRISNVSSLGFDVAPFEPTPETAQQPASTFSYLAVTPGIHDLGNGVTLEAGAVSTSAWQGRLVPGNSWQTVSFSTSFSAPVTFLHALQTDSQGALTAGASPVPWLTSTASSVGAGSARIALERSETSSGAVTSAETIGWLAIDADVQGSHGVGPDRVRFESIRTADQISGWDNGCSAVSFSRAYPNGLTVASKISRNGGDGGWLRRCAGTSNSIGLSVDEDRSNDAERNHVSESAGMLVFSAPFDDTLPGGGWEADTVSLAPVTGGSARFTQVAFPTAFSATPLVFSLPGPEGGNPASIRMRAVTPAGFEAAAVEPPGSSGAHEAMTISYLAALPGSHQLGDGSLFEAGFLDTTTVQRAANVGGSQGWDSVGFLHGYPAPPALLAQIQTTTNSDPADPSLPLVPWLTVAVSGLSANGVSLALERSEAASGSITSAERIGYFAFVAPGHGVLTDIDQQSVAWDARLVPGGASGYDDGCSAVGFTSPFAAAPVALAHSTTRNGNNGGWLRRCSLSQATIGLQVDEDQSNDAERTHVAEDVAVVAFARPFQWRPLADLVLATSALAISDPIGTGSPKAVPGAIMEYRIVATNAGRGSSDPDSVVVIDAVPTATELFVGDLDGAGHPVVFADGAAPNGSGLTFDPAVDLEFSNDGGASFSYAPAASGYDPAVTHIRMTPKGAFAPAGIGISPTFTFRYQVRIIQ